MRFPNHELHVGPKPKGADWKSMHQVITLTAHDVTEQATADTLAQLMAYEMDKMTTSFAWSLDKWFFWEPARDAYENGGCRQ